MRGGDGGDSVVGMRDAPALAKQVHPLDTMAEQIHPPRTMPFMGSTK
jgi:hypothetical protein